MVAFTRRHEDTVLVTIAGRLFAKLLDEPQRLPLGDGVWDDTAVAVGLPDGTGLTNILSGERVTVRDGRVRLGEAFGRFPRRGACRGGLSPGRPSNPVARHVADAGG